MTWKAKRRFYDHGKARVIEIGEVVELSGTMLKHAQQHDLVEAAPFITPTRLNELADKVGASTAKVSSKLNELVSKVAVDILLKDGTKAELLDELDKVAPGHEHSMRDSKAELKDALALATD